jgi:hypothetical protein
LVAALGRAAALFAQIIELPEHRFLNGASLLAAKV